MPKTKVVVFLEPAYLKLLDDFVKAGLAGNRSEVIRFIIQDWAAERKRIFEE